MCEICLMPFCPSSCPGYSREMAGRGKSVCECDVCGSSIFQGEEYLTNGEARICSDCARYIGMSELKAVCGFEKNDQLLQELGFVRVIQDQREGWA